MCALIVLSAYASRDNPNRESLQRTFRFDQQVGIAHVRGDTMEGCLAAANSSIKPGVKVTIADQPDKHFLNESRPMVETATVVELLSRDCDNYRLYTNEFSNSGPAYYRIRLDRAWKGNAYAFAIVQPSGAVVTSGASH